MEKVVICDCCGIRLSNTHFIEPKVDEDGKIRCSICGLNYAIEKAYKLWKEEKEGVAN